MKKIALVSCTKLKRNFPCEAQEMYLPSTLFQKITMFIKQSDFDEWYILSAKYGLLRKETVISPYDITLLNMKAEDRKNWAEKVAANLLELLPDECEIYCFAGEKYRQYLLPKIEEAGLNCRIPLKGMQIGEQLQYLSNRIKN